MPVVKPSGYTPADPSPFGPGGQTYTPESDSPPRDLNNTPDDGQWVFIESRALHWDLVVMLGDGPIKPSAGGATFDEVTSPADKTMLDWSGEDLWRLAVPIMLDSWLDPIEPPRRDKRPPSFGTIKKPKKRRAARERWRKVRDRDRPTNVDAYVTELVDLSQPQGRHRPPAALRIYGKAIVPRELNGELFLIEGIEWGDPMFNPRNGQLVRQALTLQLVEANAGTTYRLKKHKRKSGNHSAKRYTVKQGDTLQKIAAKFYGDASKWKRIAEANNIKNPRKLDAYVGKQIKIP